jgi:phosphatidylserine synthase
MQPENADSEADFASAVWCLSAGQAAAFAGGLQAGALALKEAAREVPRPAEGVCYAVRHGEDLREAERRLLLHAGRGAETDGWMDRAVNRRVSRAFTRLVLNTGVTPNQVTLFHCFLGLLGAVFMAFPPYLGAVLGALLFQLSVALDCSDGELARLKLQFSRLGGMLDVVGDNVVHAAVFIAIAVAAQRRLGTALAGTLGLSAAAGIFLAFMVVWWLTQWQQRRWEEGKPAGYALAPVASNHAMLGQDPSATPPGAARLDALINQLTSRDFSVLVVAAALLGRLEWMLWLAAAGAHVFWIGFLGFQLYFFRCAPSASQTTTEA